MEVLSPYLGTGLQSGLAMIKFRHYRVSTADCQATNTRSSGGQISGW